MLLLSLVVFIIEGKNDFERVGSTSSATFLCFCFSVYGYSMNAFFLFVLLVNNWDAEEAIIFDFLLVKLFVDDSSVFWITDEDISEGAVCKLYD